MSEDEDLTEGDEREEEGNTSTVMLYIQKLIKTNHFAEHGKESQGREWVGNYGGLNVSCVHVCFCHPGLQKIYDHNASIHLK